MGSKNEASIDESEIKPLINNVKIQVPTVKMNINLKVGIFTAKPNKTPTLVATPLPPLRLRKTVQLCPATAEIPIIILKKSSLRPKKSAINTVANTPLIISIIKTEIPDTFPKTLNALDAPTLPEPY